MTDHCVLSIHGRRSNACKRKDAIVKVISRVLRAMDIDAGRAAFGAETGSKPDASAS